MLVPALCADGIVAARGCTCVLAGVDFCIMPGEIVAIEGRSGAGKSTLLHILAGLLQPDFGGVIVNGVAIGQLGVAERARCIAIALQSPVLPSALSVIELVRLGRLPYERRAGLLSSLRCGRYTGLAFASKSESEIIQNAIVTMGVHRLTSRPLGSLSGGEQRRAHLARILAQQTPVLLLDEPTTHLDELTFRQLMRELQRRAERGTAVVLVTHDTAGVHRHCHRNLRLEHGSLHSVSPRPQPLVWHGPAVLGRTSEGELR